MNWDRVDHLGGLVLDAHVSASALVAVLALAMVGCPQPSRRLWLARAAQLGLIALVPLVGFGTVPRFELVEAVRAAGLFSNPGSPEMPTTAQAIGVPPELVPASWVPSARRVGRGLTLLYVGGVGFGLARLALGMMGLIWLNRRSGEPSDESRALYESLSAGMAGARPRLRVVRRVRRPVLVGLFRPMILIPPALDHPAASERLRLGILHELAHAEGGDPLFGMAANLARTAWFLLPPVWWVDAQMRLDQEFLADRVAASRFGPVREYASSLLDFANPQGDRQAARPTPGPPLADLDGTGSALFQRVLMLMRCPFPVEGRPPAWWSCGLGCVTVALTIGASSLSLRPPAAPPGPNTTGQVHTFPVAKLTVPPSPADANGRAPTFELPVRLPARFELTVEVWGDPRSLESTRIVGLPLIASGTKPDAIPPSPAGWHSVHVVRDDGDTALWIDGKSADLGPEPPPLTDWLSVEPAPDREGLFRQLVLSW